MAEAGIETAVVFGGATGIGAAAVRLFARQGARVVAAGLQAEAGRALQAELAGQGAEVLFIEADVTAEDQVAAVIEKAVERFGGFQAVVNNAGVEGRYGPVQDATLSDFDHIIGVNLKGVWLGMKHAIPHLLARGGGAIVNTASTAAVTGIANVALYTASKHAVAGLTKAAALELATSNVRVNAVAPGPVDTGVLHRMIAGKIDVSVIAERVPMQRISQPEEIAEAIVWLASPAASYVTGHILVADGGLTVT